MNMKTWMSLIEVKTANREIGHHWFDPETINFFQSRIESEIIGGRYFVTSEVPPDGKRAYSIRSVNDDGSINTEGGVEGGGRYKTRRAAMAEAKAIAKEGGGNDDQT